MTTTQTKIPERGTKEHTEYKILVMGEWLNGKPVEERENTPPVTEWVRTDDPTWNWFNRDYRIAVPPQPVVKPWTRETCPIGAAVRGKITGRLSIIVQCDEQSVYIGQGFGTTYAGLLADFEQLDGSPCGTLEEAEPKRPRWCAELLRGGGSAMTALERLARLEELNDGLFPCPFCGSDQVDPDGGLSKDGPFPVCDNCGASAESVAAWNTRKPGLIAALREAVRALEAAVRLDNDKYIAWGYAGGVNDCAHGYGEGIPCEACDRVKVQDALGAIETLLKP